MKKLILLLGIGALSTQFAQAQRVRIAPEIGLNLNTLQTEVQGYDYTEGYRAGLKAGGIIDIGFDRNFSFQPGIFYSKKGAKNEYNEYVVTNGVGTSYHTEETWALNYIEVPMNFQFKFGRPYRAQFFLGAGPYAAVLLNGNYKWQESSGVVGGRVGAGTNRSLERSLNVGDNAGFDDIRRMDAGINLNAGFIGRHAFIRANVGLGLVNLYPNGNENNRMNNFGFGLSVGYMLD